MYNPVEYWSKRKKPNPYDDLQEWDLKVLKPLADKAFKILEYGVGTGRLMPLYSGKLVRVVDIVDNYKQELFDNAYKHKVKITWSKEMYGKYDLGVLSKVLLHMEDPKPIIDEMATRCDKVFISTGVNCDAEHCFNHDYKELLKEYDILYWDLTGNDLTIVYANHS